MPRSSLPKDLRKFPNVVARELYNYRAISRGPAHVFYKEYEDSLRAGIGKEHVAFRLHDVVLFLAKAAAEGIVGNCAYSVLVRAINAIRRPKRELGGSRTRFETVVSRRTYNRVRREHRPSTKASRTLRSNLEEKLETQYRLMVTLTRGPK